MRYRGRMLCFCSRQVRSAAVLALLLAGCAPDIPDGKYVCAADADCPPGQGCADGICLRSAGCTPLDCQGLRAQCGTIDDGCGTPIECGECEAPETCGGGGIANICDCDPVSCQPGQCGDTPNGCGQSMDCGGCDGMGESCIDGACHCPAETCNGRCGMIVDPCGGPPLACGGCPMGQNCGGGGPNLCGTGTCTPMTCPAGANCGEINDGCGEIVVCGPDCVSPYTCSPVNVCTCRQQTCAELGAECGKPIDQCGNELDCPACTPPEECGVVAPNQCGCLPFACPPGSCGAFADPCGGTTILCDCPSGYACTGNACVCPPDSCEQDDGPLNACAAGTLNVGSNVLTMQYRIDAAGDDDYLRWAVNDVAGTDRTIDVSVGLTNIPTDANYDLEVTVNCRTSTMLVDFSCVQGTAHPLLPRTCVSSMSGDATEMIVARTNCTLQNLLVHVAPITTGAICAPYALAIGVNQSADTP
jgi:hypothetical protein